MKKLILLTSATVIIGLSGCNLYDSDTGGKVNKENIFDFNMEQSVSIDIDYNFPTTDYVVLFELYDQYPLTENEHGTLLKDIEPVYRGATDGSGKFNGQIKLPRVFEEVWLYSPYPATGAPVKVSIVSESEKLGKITYLKSTRAKVGTRAIKEKVQYPSSWLTLGNWDETGVPDYSLSQLELPSADLYYMNQVLVKHSALSLESRYPNFFTDDVTSEITIIKPTKLRLAFVNSTAAMLSTVGYFTYPTGNPPASMDEVKQILAFPNAQPYGKMRNGVHIGALSSGEVIQMKYWDGEKLIDEFPAGITIGWFMEADAFKLEGNIKPSGYGMNSRYSLKHLNKDGKQRTVALMSRNSDRIVAIGFEDNLDMRYNDATFYLDVEQPGAISPTIPTLPDDGSAPSDNDNSSVTCGTLAFEDLWPYMGDYDMNDLVIEYNSRIYKTIDGNKVFKIVDEFTPLHRGGLILSGFGYQLTNIPSPLVRSVTIEGIDAPSRYMNGQSLESGQNYPTVLLFDELTPNMIKKTIKVTTYLKNVNQTLVSPPYNPFIFTNSHVSREKEIHLVNYPPTALINTKYLGYGDDASKPALGLYYVTTLTLNKFPFVLNMSGVKGFPIQSESIRIDKTYPRYKSWVESQGKKDKDWYIK